MFCAARDTMQCAARGLVAFLRCAPQKNPWFFSLGGWPGEMGGWCDGFKEWVDGVGGWCVRHGWISGRKDGYKGGV
jgi:hypothetical protein